MANEVTVTAYWAGYNGWQASDIQNVTNVSDVLRELGVPAGTSNYTYAVNGESAKISDAVRDGDVVGVSKSQNKSG